MGRIIGTILGAILATRLAFMAASGIFATLKTFLFIGLIAIAVFIVVWLVARRPRRGWVAELPFAGSVPVSGRAGGPSAARI